MTFLLALLFAPIKTWAHEPSKSYVNLVVESNQVIGQWDIPLKDLGMVVPLDTDKDGAVTLDEVKGHQKEIAAYINPRLTLSADGKPGTIHFVEGDPVVEEYTDGAYILCPFTVAGWSRPVTLEVAYSIFFETNSLHRGLLRLEADGKTQSAVFSPEQPKQRLRIGQESAGRQFAVFLKEGVEHIWTGYDHILFLLALLLPAVLRREPGGWRGVPAFRPAFVNVLKIVTAFTLAHSITLSLATLQIVKLPSRLSESAIAASVILAATNNLWPMVRERGWMVAFVFGLIHGFGFANALTELGLEHGALLLTLVGFNLGVELGQMAIVVVFLPMAFGLRRSWFYQTPVLRAGSALIVVIAALWLSERVFDFKVLPF